MKKYIHNRCGEAGGRVMSDDCSTTARLVACGASQRISGIGLAPLIRILDLASTAHPAGTNYFRDKIGCLIQFAYLLLTEKCVIRAALGLLFGLLYLISGPVLADGTTPPTNGTFWRYGNTSGASSSSYPTYQTACNAWAASFPTSKTQPGRPTCTISQTNTVTSCTVVGGGSLSGNVTVEHVVSYSDSCEKFATVGQDQFLLYGTNSSICPTGAYVQTDGTCRCPSGSTLGTTTDQPPQQVCFPVTEVVLSQAPVPGCQRCEVGRPIFPLTGAVSHSLVLDTGAQSLNQMLTYNTARRLPVYPVPAPQQEYSDLEPAGSQTFGELWWGNLQKQFTSDINLAHTRVNRGDGTTVNFAYVSGVFVPVIPGESDRLSTNSPGYLYTDTRNNAEESYDLTGNLTAVQSADGKSLSYQYSDASTPLSIAPAAGYLIGISDNFARSINFIYSGSTVSQVVDVVGNSIGLGYDSSSNLKKITWQDGSFLQLLYGRSDLPWALTSLVDERGSTNLSYEYDASGRATATQSGSGAARYSVDYGASAPALSVLDTTASTDPVIVLRTRGIAMSGTPVVTNPNGSQMTVSASVIQQMPRLATVSQAAGAGTAASTKQQTYDPVSGNRLSAQDFNGNRTCYAYESTRSLITVTLEGLPSTKACPSTLSSYVPNPVDAAHPERKTTTVWHPDWTLKAQEAEPKKISTWVYNGQPDPIAGTTASCVTLAVTLPDGKPLAVLCARYEQATTDRTGAQGLTATVTGATRAWTYTYNQYGQVLTQTTPKQSPTDVLSHTTTYAYYPTTSFSGSVGYTMGDLNTITNPLLQVTTFTSYDKAGRLLSSKDANSTVTTMTYLPRGWLHTQTITPASGSPLTTTYDYWPTGLLKTVTMPDASTLNYAYDDAHRLTDVTDAAGNKIHYVLDNAGNRAGEQVTDASGQLASTVTRVYDQLNRVQGATGAMH